MLVGAPSPDDQMSVSELTVGVLRLMASRIEASNSFEQIMYRETELDEIWRLADIAVAEARLLGAAGGGELERCVRVRALVHRAHDLVGNDEDTLTAAATLREAAALVDQSA